MLYLLCEVKSRKASYVRPRSQFLVGMVMAPTYILLCLGIYLYFECFLAYHCCTQLQRIEVSIYPLLSN